MMSSFIYGVAVIDGSLYSPFYGIVAEDCSGTCMLISALWPH